MQVRKLPVLTAMLWPAVVHGLCRTSPADRTAGRRYGVNRVELESGGADFHVVAFAARKSALLAVVLPPSSQALSPFTGGRAQLRRPDAFGKRGAGSDWR
jgi:hypothetical protein